MSNSNKDNSNIEVETVLEGNQNPSSGNSSDQYDKENNLNDSKNKDEVNSKINLKNELKKARFEAKENFEQTLRIRAELENYKKRSIREMDDLKKYALTKITKELLTVVDNLERALQSSREESEDKSNSSILKGIDLTLNELLKILENHNVVPIKAVGKPFDPKIHQAMSQEETSKYPPNIIIREYFKGYLIGDRLLRAAMVTVAKKSNKRSEKQETAE